jgi:hypothetical protein
VPHKDLHASSHKHGGSDEIANATPGANEIPKADGSGKLASGWGGSASTLATLDGSSKVVQDPANAQTTPAADKIPLADGSGKLAAGWGGSASTLATLDGSSKVVEDPANAQTSPGASKIPLADGSGNLAAGWGGAASSLATLDSNTKLVQDPAVRSSAHSSGAPAWLKITKTYSDFSDTDTKTYSDFSDTDTQNDIEILSLPAGGVIHEVKIKHSEAFTGGSISAYTISVGITGTLDKYCSAFNVFQAPGNTVQALGGVIGTENHGAATSIRADANSTDGNLNAATQGSVDIWILYSVVT